MSLQIPREVFHNALAYLQRLALLQVGPLLCEDAPQELRSRMWMALLADRTLCGNLLEEKVLRSETSEHGDARATPLLVR